MTNHPAHLDRVFQALAGSTRRAVVERLGRGPAAVGDLAASFDLALPTFMRHLGVLEESGVITSEKLGRVRTCRLAPRPLSLAEQWMAQQRLLWERRLDQLDSYLATLPETDA